MHATVFSRLLITTLLLCPAVTLAAIYKHVDEHGNVTYTDTPSDKAENVKLPPINTTPAVRTRKPTPAEEKEDIADYTVRIAAPSNESHIPPGQQNIPVSIAVDPSPEEGYQLQVLFDGSPYGSPSSSPTALIEGVYRGTHHISAQLIDSDGKVVARSEPVIVYVQRIGINHPSRKGSP